MRRFLTASLLVLLTATAAYAGDSEYRWIDRNDRDAVEVRIRGSVELGDDSTSIVRMERGASVYVEERMGGSKRSVTVRAGDGGSLAYEYRVNGRTAPFDQEAQALLARLLKRSVEEGGLNAEARARRILAEHGPSGLLDAVEAAKGDYLRGLLLEKLVEAGRPDAETSRRALGLVASAIESDYYKAQALGGFVGEPLADRETREAFFEAYATLDSDYYLSEVLGAAVAHHDRDAELLREVAGATDRIGSDYYKAQVLGALAAHARGDDALHAAIVEAARHIEADYYREQVLSSF